MITSQPEVSVVVCVRNGAATVARQLAALDQQGGDIHFEIIVVDNGSDDDTPAILREWTSGAAHTASKVTVVTADAKPGIPYARNAGISQARGRIIAFCDADDSVASDWVSTIARDLPPGCVGGGRVLARLRDGTPKPDTFPDGLINHGFLPFASGCNMFAWREVLDAVNGFDEALPPYGYDDVDFSWHAQALGYPIVYVPGAVVDMELSSGTSSLRKRFLLGKGRVYMAHKYPGYDPIPYSLRICTAEVVSATIDCVRNGVQSTPAGRRQLASRLASSAGKWWGYTSHQLALNRYRVRPEIAFRRDSRKEIPEYN